MKTAGTSTKMMGMKTADLKAFLRAVPTVARLAQQGVDMLAARMAVKSVETRAAQLVGKMAERMAALMVTETAVWKVGR